MADWYDKTLSKIGKGLLDLDNLSDPKIVPVTIDYVFNQAHEFLSDIPGADRVSLPATMTNVRFGPFGLSGGVAAPTDYNQYFTFDNVDSSFIFDETAGSRDLTILTTGDYAAGVDGDAVKKTVNTQGYNGTQGLSIPAQKSVSIAFWIEQDGTISADPGESDFGALTTLGSDFTNSGIIIDCLATAGTLRFLVGNNSTFTSVGYGLSGAADIRDGVRHHIALVIDFKDPDTEILAYYDGVARASATAMTGAIDWANNNLSILGRTSSNSWLINVLVDEYKPYARALTQAEVIGLYNEFAIAGDANGKHGWLDADDPVITGPTVDDIIEAFVMLNDTGVEATSPILFYSNEATGLPFTVQTTGNITIQLASENGIAKL